MKGKVLLVSDYLDIIGRRAVKHNTQYVTGITLIALSLFASRYVSADVLELKDGQVLNGSYKGGTQATLRFEVGGQVKVVPVKDIMALTFTGGSSATAPVSKATSTTSALAATTGHPSENNGPKTVAVGTTLLVRTAEEIGTHNKKEGQRFSAKLEAKLMAGSVQVAPAGATVYGRVLKSNKGGIGRRKAILELTLTEIKIDGQLRPIKTSVLTGEGESGGLGRKILKGAAVGGLADGSSGADTGARAGAGIGILAGGKHAGLKSGTIIEFTLVEALNL